MKYKTPLYTKGISDIRPREYKLNGGQNVVICKDHGMSGNNVFIGWSYPPSNENYFESYQAALNFIEATK